MDTPIKKLAFAFVSCVILILSFFLYKAGGVFSVTAFWAFCVIALLSLVALCTPYGSENYFDRHKKGSILFMTAAVIFLVISITLKYELCKENPGILAPVFQKISEYFDGADLFGYYTAQLSLTFITISVMSVLSDKSVIIYWTNVSEDMLIRPTFSCFAAYTYYSIGMTIAAGLGVVLKNPTMFILFFSLNVCVLICLTLSMIDVYYGRDTKKKKLAKTLVPDAGNKAPYESRILGLEQNLLSAYDQKDIVFLREVYDLYCEYPEKFDFDIGQEAIAVIVSTLDAQTSGTFLRALDKILTARLSHFPMSSEEITKGLHRKEKPLCDTELWWTLCSNRAGKFLQEVSVSADNSSTQNGILFTKLMVRRLTLEYNAYAAEFLFDKLQKGEKVDPNLYFVYDEPLNSLYAPKTSYGNPVSYECFKEVFDYITHTFRCDFLLLDSIITLINRILKDGKNWYTLKALSALPYIDYWADGGLAGGLGAYKPDAEEAVKRMKAIRDSMEL